MLVTVTWRAHNPLPSGQSGSTPERVTLIMNPSHLFSKETQLLQSIKYKNIEDHINLGSKRENVDEIFPLKTITSLLNHFCANANSHLLIKVFKLSYELETIFNNWNFVRGPRGFTIHHYYFFRPDSLVNPKVDELKRLVKHTIENLLELSIFLDNFKVNTSSFNKESNYFAILTYLTKTNPSLNALSLCLDNVSAENISEINMIIDNKICTKYNDEWYTLGIRDEDSGYVYIIAPEVQRYFNKIRWNFENSFWVNF